MPETIKADLAANVWKVLVKPGDVIAEDATIAILESMKMEIPVVSEVSGTVVTVHVAEGQMVSAGQPIADIDED